MSLAFIGHPLCRAHRMGPHHPECPERLDAIADRLIAAGLDSLLTHYEAPAATEAQLARVHDPDYIREIFDAAPEGDELRWLDGDTAMNAHSLPAALRAAGAAVLGVDLVMSNRHQVAFACVRPPGHHAERHRAMGFCIFNNVAVGAAHALAVYGLERIAIIDFDVHHGNGTQNIFAGDERVRFCSSFQHPFYPGSGAGNNASNILNIPLPRGTDGPQFRKAVETHWLAQLDEFAPQMILISAGFDGHAEDEMAQFNLRESDYAWITRELQYLAGKHAQGRILSCLEGGYHLNALGRAVSAHLDALIGQP